MPIVRNLCVPVLGQCTSEYFNKSCRNQLLYMTTHDGFGEFGFLGYFADCQRYIPLIAGQFLNCSKDAVFCLSGSRHVGDYTIHGWGAILSATPEFLPKYFKLAGMLHKYRTNWRDSGGFVGKAPLPPGGTFWDSMARWDIFVANEEKFPSIRNEKYEIANRK
jgi:hypothetical protein